MKQLVLNTDIYRYGTCREFAEKFQLCDEDLILTNEYIYTPFFGKMNLPAKTLYQEEYGSGEPTDIMVEAILSEAEKTGCKRVVAIGGGTIIDIAKILAVSGGESLDALYDAMPNLSKKRSLVIIPTTCGTGSEVTNLSIINRLRLGTKMGLVSESMFADCAVLIPELLGSLPYGVFATSSIDALVHAVESTLSPKATPYTKLFGYKAVEMILGGYQRLAKDSREALPELLEDFLIASNFAGIAFGTAGCAAVHALSYPLGGTYHVPHGESNYAMFTGVLRAYLKVRIDGEMAVFRGFLGRLLDCSASQSLDRLDELLNAVLTKKALREYGVDENDVLEFTKTVMEKQQRLMSNNFVPLSEEQVKEIYMQLL